MRHNRPGPLQELPLELFAPTNPNHYPTSTLKHKSIKRPLSPGVPCLFSPAKRRILSEEGIIPETPVKGALSRKTVAAKHFADVLRGADSPARKLDFGPPKHHETGQLSTASTSTQSTRSTPVSTSHLTPSPELVIRTIVSRASSSSAPPVREDDAEMRSLASQPLSPRLTSTLLAIPRELPPIDPKSIHYPGFYIHRDTHTFVLDPSSVVNTDTDESSLSSLEQGTKKENVPPRRRSKKAVTAPCSSDANGPFPLSDAKIPEMEKSGKAGATLATPQRAEVDLTEAVSLTPRSRGISLAPNHISRPLLGSQRRRTLRQMLDEADEVELDDTVGA